MDYGFQRGDSALLAERRFAMNVLIEPLLEPLQSAFGDYSAIAQQTFATELSRIAERADA